MLSPPFVSRREQSSTGPRWGVKHSVKISQGPSPRAREPSGASGRTGAPQRRAAPAAARGRAQGRRADSGQRHLARRGAKKGARDPAGEAAAVSTELPAPLARVCRVLDAPRSTASYRRHRLRVFADGVTGVRPGPASALPDAQLVALIRQVLAGCPFAARASQGAGPAAPRALGARRRQAGAAADAGRGPVGPPAGEPTPGQARPRRLHRAGRTQPALGHRRHDGLDSAGRLGLGLRLGRPPHRRGLGARGQGR